MITVIIVGAGHRALTYASYAQHCPEKMKIVGVQPVKVSSFGGLHYFTRAKAPENSGKYCLLDCPIEKECLYSARKHYLDHPDRWSFYVWAGIEHLEQASLADKEAFLKDKSNPYSQCVWKLDNDVVDRQSVLRHS